MSDCFLWCGAWLGGGASAALLLLGGVPLVARARAYRRWRAGAEDRAISFLGLSAVSGQGGSPSPPDGQVPASFPRDARRVPPGHPSPLYCSGPGVTGGTPVGLANDAPVPVLLLPSHRNLCVPCGRSLGTDRLPVLPDPRNSRIHANPLFWGVSDLRAAWVAAWRWARLCAWTAEHGYGFPAPSALHRYAAACLIRRERGALLNRAKRDSKARNAGLVSLLNK